MAKKEIKNGCHLYPMPIVLVGAIKDGKANFMPAAFAGIVNINPPIISLGLSKRHFTCAGMVENGVFSVNLPSTSMMKATDYCGLVSGHKVDKSGVFKVFYGKLDKAPMIEECPLTMECRLLQNIELGADNAFLGEIVATYCDDQYMDGKMPDLAKLDLLIFSMSDNSYWSIGKKLGTAWSVGKGYK
ncbi:MAG: flavin reductase family protein [Chloroflexi bacterium]|nr:flavin reductase family protein [Chloroflexota bacterium]